MNEGAVGCPKDTKRLLFLPPNSTEPPCHQALLPRRDLHFSMFFLSTLSSMALVAVSVTSIAASPLSPRATPSCYGITGPFFINGKSYALDGQTVSSPVVVSGTTNLSAIWYANGHGGAPCDSGFALGITKDSLSNAPKTLLSSE